MLHRTKNCDELLKLLITVIVCISLIFVSYGTIFALTDDVLIPNDNQFFELRAVLVTDIAGQNKQVIMELWGNNIEFKRI